MQTIKDIVKVEREIEALQPTTPQQSEFVPIHIVLFVMPRSSNLVETVVNTLGEEKVVLLKNHGMFCCGKNIKAAMAATIYTEEMVTIAYYVKLFGKYEPLPEEAIQKMKALIAADQAV
jgi:ribulose-5-phosphate 4-epimerase/fuculose-1-phosphate aldolase